MDNLKLWLDWLTENPLIGVLVLFIITGWIERLVGRLTNITITHKYIDKDK